MINWLIHRLKDALILNKLGVFNIPWLDADGRILKLGEIGMLEWLCCFKPNLTQGTDLKGTVCTKAIGCKLVRGPPAQLKSPVVGLFLVSDIMVEVQLLICMS